MRLTTQDTPGLTAVPVAADPLEFNADRDPACSHLDLRCLTPGPEAQTLRDEFKLDGVVRSCATDFERAVTLCQWVHSRWEHVSDIPSRPQSAVEILRRAAAGERFRCAEYGLVLGRVLNAKGLPARSIGLRTLDVATRQMFAGHVGTEVFLRDLGRWVFFDPQFDLVTVLGGMPLSAVELQSALARDEPVQCRTSTATEPARYLSFIKPYLTFFNVAGVDPNGKIWDVSLVPLGLLSPLAFEGAAYTAANRIATHSLATFYPA
jgi:transglutaminase-like putative cysteine protease